MPETTINAILEMNNEDDREYDALEARLEIMNEYMDIYSTECLDNDFYNGYDF